MTRRRIERDRQSPIARVLEVAAGVVLDLVVGAVTLTILAIGRRAARSAAKK